MPAHRDPIREAQLRAALPENPSIAEVLQELLTTTNLPVKHNGPLSTWRLPSVALAPRTRTLTNGAQPAQLLAPDPRRSAVTLLAISGTFALSTSYQGAQTDDAAQWATGLPLTLHTADEVWAVATGEADAVVTVIEEFWAR